MATKLKPETEDLLALIATGIQRARPSTVVTPDFVVNYALQSLRHSVESVFPQYFETKAAVAERKAA